MEVIPIITLIISFIGMTIITWGALLAFIKFLTLEYGKFRKKNICRKREVLRHHLGSYLLLGLEFMIAADVIRTIAQPDMQALMILGVIVAIRTVISYFLNKETGGSHDCDELYEED